MRTIMPSDLIGREVAQGRDWKDGAYQLPGPCGASLRIIVSYGQGWDHVSVSLPNRNPNWQEMDYVKNLFWDEEETVIQYHIAASLFVQNHPYCLHLWKPREGCVVSSDDAAMIPTPPRWLVGSYPGWEHDLPQEYLDEALHDERSYQKYKVRQDKDAG